MVHQLILQVTPLVEQYGALGVFVLSLVEETIAPIPSSLALLATGFFLLQSYDTVGQFLSHAIFRLLLPATLGLTIGQLFVYSLALVGGEPLVRRWGSRLGVSWIRVEQFTVRFSRGRTDELIVFGLRALPVVPNFLVSAVCGLIRYPLKSFLVTSFLGNLVRALLMGFVGWSVGGAYIVYADRLSTIGNVVVGLFSIGIGFLLLRHLRKRRRAKRES